MVDYFTEAEIEELDSYVQKIEEEDNIMECEVGYFDPEAWYFDEKGNVLYAPDHQKAEVAAFVQKRKGMISTEQFAKELETRLRADLFDQ